MAHYVKQSSNFSSFCIQKEKKNLQNEGGNEQRKPTPDVRKLTIPSESYRVKTNFSFPVGEKKSLFDFRRSMKKANVRQHYSPLNRNYFHPILMQTHIEREESEWKKPFVASFYSPDRQINQTKAEKLFRFFSNSNPDILLFSVNWYWHQSLYLHWFHTTKCK